MQGEKGEDWRRAPKLRCERASDVCPMIALSFTASLLLQLFFELFACENITSALPPILPLYSTLFCHEIQEVK